MLRLYSSDWSLTLRNFLLALLKCFQFAENVSNPRVCIKCWWIKTDLLVVLQAWTSCRWTVLDNQFFIACAPCCRNVAYSRPIFLWSVTSVGGEIPNLNCIQNAESFQNSKLSVLNNGTCVSYFEAPSTNLIDPALQNVSHLPLPLSSWSNRILSWRNKPAWLGSFGHLSETL